MEGHAMRTSLLTTAMLLLMGCATTGVMPTPPVPSPTTEKVGCVEAGRRGLPAPEDTVGCTIARWYGVATAPRPGATVDLGLLLLLR